MLHMIRVGEDDRKLCLILYYFREKFKKTRENGDSIEIDRKGFETWKNMSTQVYLI